ncbi:hypothetical protein EEB12_21050 [Rhodococcus sp. WS1]|uniref:hypothetical protein n=1 Tax=unclassified Rhodococcus (in: high G+C Gram-positive bacteria) TaxID=192944 RepID=UPI001142F045|nr:MULTISPECIES: hypothetical protein [unclassified Rhodococcus (in: high G+C Gram-positive bacteria)]ROZ56205.1 hypothetical protein EEB12_21050 [Rhodococcus sp. WS1]TQC40397.1 hypothetical protein EEB16_01285 [Rhodococcus sp. WS7]
MLNLKVRDTRQKSETDVVFLYGLEPPLKLFTITRTEWTALPPGDFDARDWLHPDQIEARIFARMAELLRTRMPSSVGGYNVRSVPGFGGNPLTVGLQIWLAVHLAGWHHVPTEEAMRKVAEAKTRAVDEQRNAIREWLVYREGAENAY